MAHKVKGSQLKVGQCIEVWWAGHRDIITALRPYKGSLAHLFGDGAQIAEFSICKAGMTIDNSDYYNVIA